MIIIVFFSVYDLRCRWSGVRKQLNSTIHIEMCVFIIINDRVILMTITGRTWYGIAPITGEREEREKKKQHTCTFMHTHVVRLLYCPRKECVCFFLLGSCDYSILLLDAADVGNHDCRRRQRQQYHNDDVAKFSQSIHIQESLENHTVTIHAALDRFIWFRLDPFFLLRLLSFFFFFSSF